MGNIASTTSRKTFKWEDVLDYTNAILKKINADKFVVFKKAVYADGTQHEDGSLVCINGDSFYFWKENKNRISFSFPRRHYMSWIMFRIQNELAIKYDGWVSWEDGESTKGDPNLYPTYEDMIELWINDLAMPFEYNVLKKEVMLADKPKAI